MSRRTERAASQAAEAATEAARTLAARSHEARAERSSEPSPEPSEPKPEKSTSPEKLEALRAERPHTKAMNDLIQRRGLDPEPEEAPKPAEAATEAQAPEASASPPAAATAPEAPVPATVKVKVDGQEFDAPASEVEEAGGIKAYQIMKAAEKRLEEANRTLADAKKYQIDLGQLAQALRQPQEQPKPKETDAEFIAARADILRFGTAEEMARAQLEIQQRFAPKIDPNAITQQAVDRFHHDMAVREFDKEFQDLVTNPIRLKAVVALRQELLEKHKIERPNQGIDWNSFYRTIGTQVRSALGGHHQSAGAPQAPASTTSQQADKEARKASIVNLPTAAARAEGPKEEKPLTPEEERKQAIAELRKTRRGQTG